MKSLTKTKILFAIILQLLIFSAANAQSLVRISGIVKDKNTKTSLPFVNIVLKTEKDSTFVSGTATNEDGRFALSKIKLRISTTSHQIKNATSNFS